ncbi:MAG: type II toxin-antitoxin system HicB family antitoxin [Chloroflexi bacterium]|nr:type II toxin-antitoxin system HicB family antitoxin [Chloroflexota bacterium]
MSAHQTYLVTLIQGEDGYIVAECPSLPGCVSQGKTREEALENIKEAIEGILELRRKDGFPFPKPEVVEVAVAA